MKNTVINHAMFVSKVNVSKNGKGCVVKLRTDRSIAGDLPEHDHCVACYDNDPNTVNRVKPGTVILPPIEGEPILSGGERVEKSFDEEYQVMHHHLWLRSVGGVREPRKSSTADILFPPEDDA